MSTIVKDEEYEQCNKTLKESISRKRYDHSIGVSNTAACLAMRYGFDMRKAYLAGLLHDCAKGLSEDELLAVTKRAGMTVSDTERKNPELLHAKAGKVIAKETYGIEDDDILDPIYWHTTGKPAMTLPEKIIFVADYIEPHRTNLPKLDEIRQMSFTDIDMAIAMICKNTLDYLKDNEKNIDVSTVETYEYYIKR